MISLLETSESDPLQARICDTGWIRSWITQRRENPRFPGGLGSPSVTRAR
jgi:hypothetical protein